MDAAAQIAETLHISEPAEEEPILVTVLRRLCLVADTDYVSARVRKLASHAGGVPPIAGKLLAFADTPHVADPGNATYAAIVTRLIAEVGNDPRVPPWGLAVLQKLNTEHKGDVVEAALAAANAAADKEEGKERIWAELRGGACASSDQVTPWIVRAVLWECRTAAVAWESKLLRGASCNININMNINSNMNINIIININITIINININININSTININININSHSRINTNIININININI